MKSKKLFTLIIAVLIILSCISTVFALEKRGLSNNNTLNNDIFNQLVEHISYKYGDVYSFSNFEYEIQQVREDENYWYVDINVITDMTLVQHPSKSNYFIAMTNQANKIIDSNTKELVLTEINSYVNEIERMYYNVSEKSVFKYTAKIEKISSANFMTASSYQLMYRVDVSDEEFIVTPIINVEKVNSSFDDACAAATNIDSIIESITNKKTVETHRAINAVTYNRITARDYALEHATDEPEFSYANGQGSDCANFVSKALNAGGFPIDRANNWYPSSNGTTATCGTNWMRTGYYNNGGVVPYMLSKGYFYKQSDESCVNAGSIMSWNSSSHVALVTYGDTVTIKYTQHSNYTLSESAAKNIVYESENATFYMPDTSKVTVEE